MARKARVKDEYGVFVISQDGSNERPLFKNEMDRKKFLEILKRAEKKYQFKLHAYCIGDINHFDLVIDVNGGDVSKIMKSINIAYAMYVKSKNKLFKDRYKSVLLVNDKELNNVLADIRSRKSEKEYWRICYDISQKDNFIHNAYFEDCDNCINCYEIAERKLDTIAELEQSTRALLIKDKEKRNELIKVFRKNTTLSMKEIGKLFGDISESSVCKILNKC